MADLLQRGGGGGVGVVGVGVGVDFSNQLQPLVDQMQQHHIADHNTDAMVSDYVLTTSSPDEEHHRNKHNWGGDVGEGEGEGEGEEEEEELAMRKFAPATKKRKRNASAPSKPSEIRTRSSNKKAEAVSPSSSTALPPAMPRKSAHSHGGASANAFKASSATKRSNVSHNQGSSSASADPAPAGPCIPIPAAGQVMPTDQLVCLTTPQFDTWLQHLTESREITTDEDAMLKLVRRRIRNRESARDSRSNRKSYLQTLQGQVDDLKLNNHHLGMTMSSLKSENKALKEEAMYLQDMIKATPALNSLFNTIVTAACMGQIQAMQTVPGASHGDEIRPTGPGTDDGASAV